MNGARADELRSGGFRGALRPDANLAPMTTWRIGGPADLVAEPADVRDLTLAIEWATSVGLPWRVMGNASNLLIRDAGVRGMVLRIRKVLDKSAEDGETWIVGAGHSFPNLSRRTARAGRTGLEFGGGIPGTIGGAVVMNAGWHEFEIANALESVRTVRADGKVLVYSAKECEFGYRQSRFRGQREVVVEATFKLGAARPDEIRATMVAFAASRKANQPTDLASCGSVFLKPPGDFAGRLIEQSGLKGQRVGGIEVSSRHANFFVNRGGGTSADALELVERVEAEVLRQFGVRLVREFEIW